MCVEMGRACARLEPGTAEQDLIGMPGADLAPDLQC